MVKASPHFIFATYFNQKRWMLTQYHSGSLRTLWENEQTRFHLSCFNNDTIHRQMKRKQSEASCVIDKLCTGRRRRRRRRQHRLLSSLDFMSGDPQGARVTDAASLFSASLLRSSQQNEVRHAGNLKTCHEGRNISHMTIKWRSHSVKKLIMKLTVFFGLRLCSAKPFGELFLFAFAQ